MDARMEFENLTENPQESVIMLTILGLLLAQGLNAINAGVLGRSFIYLGEVLSTISTFMAAKEVEENIQGKIVEVTKDNLIAAVSNKDTEKNDNDNDNIRVIIKQLQQQNESLQRQISTLQAELFSIKNK